LVDVWTIFTVTAVTPYPVMDGERYKLDHACITITNTHLILYV